MSFPFPNLFSSMKIGILEIRNRIVMLPMSTNLPNENGGVTSEMVDYYAERAKGGAGLIIVESACVDFPEGRNGAAKLRCDQINFVPGLSRLADAIHVYGAKSIIQIQHAGFSTSKEKTFGYCPVAPSPVYNDYGEIIAKELSEDKIEEIIYKFTITAKYAKEAGFDGVEVHGAHSYLIAQFLSPLANKREDKYGGDLENRARFLLKIINSIRKVAGSDFIISVRLNGDEFAEGGLDIEQAKRIAVLLESCTVDLLNISSGFYNHADGLSMYNPQGWRVNLAKEIKQVVRMPVIASGGIKDPKYAEDVLSMKYADFIGLGRALIADPFWPSKASRGEISKIRKCMSCNVGCAGRRISGCKSIKCSVNPDVGQEGKTVRLVSNNIGQKKVVVIGAGPAGLNAALEAKKRGHSVVVFEKDSRIGGLVQLASTLHYKELLRDYILHLSGLVERYDLAIHLNKEATFEMVKDLNPDVVVFATGSRPRIPDNVLGIRSSYVITAYDLLKSEWNIYHKNIIILGGGSTGCEIAYFLSGENRVTIVEINDVLAGEIERINRTALIKRLEEMQVNTILGAKLDKINRNSAIISRKGDVYEIPVDLVVISTGGISAVPEWTEKIRYVGAEYHVIGDASKPGKLAKAVWEGAAIGRMI